MSNSIKFNTSEVFYIIKMDLLFQKTKRLYNICSG